MKNILYSLCLGIAFVSMAGSPSANASCCRFLDDSDSSDSSSSSRSISEEALFGSPQQWPVVPALTPDHEDSLVVRTLGAFLDESRTTSITTGSLLGFTDPGIIGKSIQACSTDSKRGFSHVALAVVAKPSEMMSIIQASIREGGLSTRKKKYQTAQLEAMIGPYPYLKEFVRLKKGHHPSNALRERLAQEKNDVFCFESTGAPDEVLRGIAPRVRVAPLSSITAHYRGDLCIRPLNERIALNDLQPVLAKELGVSYEKKVLQLIGSTKNRNRIEDSSSWFCSELTAHIYKLFGVIDDPLILANNVTPSQFQSWSEGDLLRGKAGDECYLREYVKERNAYKEQKISLKRKMKDLKNGKWAPFRIIETEDNSSMASGEENLFSDSEVQAPTQDNASQSASTSESSEQSSN